MIIRSSRVTSTLVQFFFSYLVATTTDVSLLVTSSWHVPRKVTVSLLSDLNSAFFFCVIMLQVSVLQFKEERRNWSK
jgi:hypothetical protein